MEHNDSKLLRKLADELDLSGRHLEQLSETLCADADVVQKFLPDLQVLDQVAQLQNCIADVLRATDMHKQTQKIPLEALKRRVG